MKDLNEIKKFLEVKELSNLDRVAVQGGAAAKQKAKQKGDDTNQQSTQN